MPNSEELEAASDEEEEEEEEPENAPDAENEEADGNAKDGALGDANEITLEDDEQAAKDTAQHTDGDEINVSSFDNLVLDESRVFAAKEAWRLFLSAAESREAAGEAIYSALFESAPSLQSLFTSPRAVQAMRFMNGLASFVGAMDDPPKLKILVETLGFGHLHLDVTVPRVVIFRDAILDLLRVELVEKFTSQATEGWRKLLNYVGGAIIFVKAHYADRINTLLESWKACNGDSSGSGMIGAEGEEEGEEKKEGAKDQKDNKEVAESNGGMLGRLFNRKKQEDGNGNVTSSGDAAKGSSKSKMSAASIPTTYNDMFRFNAAVMGFGNQAWLGEVLACFDHIVTNVSNSSRLQEECDVLILRIARVATGTINTAEYKSCMLASLRSLLPKDWSTNHEVAWTWLWENVERLLLKNMGNPPKWEKALGNFAAGLSEEMQFELRKDIYTRFFAAAPAGQDFFKQSNTYLHFIADRVLKMTMEIYADPVKMVDDISALGLRHVGYAIPTELVGAFVSACVEVVQVNTKNEDAVTAFSWSLALIAKMLVRTITEGSTIVMKAINSNSTKQLKKAIGCAPRGERNRWLLLVQVGTQSISPLAWAIESGALESAQAIIQDLMTIRADRDRYYYGMDELFNRHPDIIKTLCNDAPSLLPALLTGLIWRSRTTEAGQRRVNYYIKHLLMDDQDKFSPTLGWISKTKDPKIVCHPVIALLADTVWTKVARRAFMYRKSWFLLTLIVFICGQSILKHLNDGENTDTERNLVFAFRAFIYCLSMTHLLLSHGKRWWSGYRNGDTFKLLRCIPLPNYLLSWQHSAGALLVLCLTVMLSTEPIIWCMNSNSNKMFYEDCPAADPGRDTYAVFSCFAMFLYFALLVDLAVCSTRVSAYVLVVIRMLSEVSLFLLALIGMQITFSSAISVLKHDQDDFAGIPVGWLTLMEIALRMRGGADFEKYERDVLALFAVFLYTIGVAVLVNMLVAQLTCAYESVYVDMVGYARLERVEIIVITMPSVPAKRWLRFLEILQLHQKVEFNAGDVGVAGGVQIMEPSSANPTNIDQIRRFGGSTAVEQPWPAEDEDGDENDRFERMEKLVQKAMKRLTKGGGGEGRGGTTGSSGKGGSSGQSGENGGSGSSGGQSEADSVE